MPPANLSKITHTIYIPLIYLSCFLIQERKYVQGNLSASSNLSKLRTLFIFHRLFSLFTFYTREKIYTGYYHCLRNRCVSELWPMIYIPLFLSYFLIQERKCTTTKNGHFTGPFFVFKILYVFIFHNFIRFLFSRFFTFLFSRFFTFLFYIYSSYSSCSCSSSSLSESSDSTLLNTTSLFSASHTPTSSPDKLYTRPVDFSIR